MFLGEVFYSSATVFNNPGLVLNIIGMAMILIGASFVPESYKARKKGTTRQ